MTSLANEPSGRLSHGIRRLLSRDEIALFGVLLVLMVGFGVIESRTVQPSTLMDVVREIAPNMIAGLGMAIVILGRNFDVSVGSMLALAGVVMIEVVNLTGSTLIGVVGALAMGLLVGAFHGVLVAHYRLNSLMMTLATLFLLRGVVYVWTGQVTMTPDEPLIGFSRLYHGSFLGIPTSGWVVLVLYLMAGWIMHQTSTGRSIYAMGANEEAARAAGVNVKRLQFGLFVASGFLAAVAGLVLAAQTGAGYFDAGLGFEFIVIAAVVVGGVSLLGGRGTIFGAALGVMIIGFTGKGLRMVGAHTTWQLVATGLLMMTALYLYGARRQWRLRHPRAAATGRTKDHPDPARSGGQEGPMNWLGSSGRR